MNIRRPGVPFHYRHNVGTYWPFRYGSRGPVFFLMFKAWIPAFAGMTVFLGTLLCWAQPSVSIRTQVSPREAYIGDVIEVRLTVIFTQELKPQPLHVPDPPGEFKVLSYSTSPLRMEKTAKAAQDHILTLTTFSTGTQTLPPLSVSFAGPDGKLLEAKTEPVEIRIKSLLEEKGDLGGLRPLKGLYDFRSTLWLYVLFVIAAAAAAAVFLKKRLRARKRGAPSEAPARPPEETAWEALRELEASDLLSLGHTKEFYYRLSTILRRYLEDRFRFSALEKTTSELLSEFRQMRGITVEFMELARDFFGNADLVKFAKFSPGEEEIENDLFRVKKMVSMTTAQSEERVPV